jgi:hypothetical protein
MKNMYTVLVGNTKSKRAFRRPRRRWKIILKRILDSSEIVDPRSAVMPSYMEESDYTYQIAGIYFSAILCHELVIEGFGVNSYY